MDNLFTIRLASPLALLLTLWGAPAAAQSLSDYLSPAARESITREHAQRRVGSALRKLEHSSIPRRMLMKLVSSAKAAPYLSRALPQLAGLSKAHGIEDVVKRLTRGGQNGAYELAVAHAFRKEIKSVSTFVGGNEVDGLLRSGTIIESKSGRPKRPEHILVQARRRAEDGSKVVLALNYKPRAPVLRKLKKLNRELKGRLEVQYLPLTGNSYQVLVNGRKVEDPTNRRNVDAPKKVTRQVKVPRRMGSPRTQSRGKGGSRSWGHWFKPRPRQRAVRRRP